MKISIATSVFVNYQLLDALEQIIAIGFEGVDIWCGRPHAFRKDIQESTFKDLRFLLESKGVTPVSLMPAFFRYPFSLSSPNETIRQDSIMYMKDCIDNAISIGAPNVLVVPTHSLHGQSTEESRNFFISSLKEVASHASYKKIKLGIEIVYPQLSDYLNSSTDALSIIHQVKADCLGVVLDTGHLNLSKEDQENALQRLQNLLIQVHINDNDQRQQQNLIPGYGKFDFLNFFRLLRKYKYESYLSLELGWNYSFDPIPAAREAFQRLQALINTKP